MFCQLQEIHQLQDQNGDAVYQLGSPISVEIKQILLKSFGENTVDI